MGRNGFKVVKGISGLYHRDNGMYYARFSVGGKKTWQSLRTKLKSVAEPRLAEIKKELREIEVDKDSDSSDVNMGDLIKKIEEDLRISELEAELEAVKLELESRPTIEQLQDARNGSIVIDSENGAAAITLNIEESEDLKTWQKTGEKLTKTIQLKDGKKFYRFALDK